MKKTILFGLLGLIVGYLIFGRSGGSFISITHLLDPPQNLLDDIGQSLTGIKAARQNILISGAVGAGLGAVISAIQK